MNVVRNYATLLLGRELAMFRDNSKLSLFFTELSNRLVELGEVICLHQEQHHGGTANCSAIAET